MLKITFGQRDRGQPGRGAWRLMQTPPEWQLLQAEQL